MLNWKLIANPWNWVIIILMVLIAGVGVDIVLTAATGHDPLKGVTSQ